MQRRFVGLAAALVLVLGVVGCSDDCTECPPDGTAPQLAYVGSETCASCHEDIYNIFIESGHPYKLTEVTGDTGPTYPWDAQHNYTVSDNGPPPDGTSWSDFAYVIGGYGWKARWVQNNGRVYTTTENAQLNLDAPSGEDEWVAYEFGNDDKQYNYNCFRCHTTGASEEGSWPEGEAGFGTFAFGGVQCEGCHGQGSQHGADPERFPMMVDDSPELCGRCHTRDSQNRIAVSGSSPQTTFIKHHEQYDELIHSPHAAIGCSGCHDPHASVVFDDIAAGSGVIADCTSAGCHEGYDANLVHNGMPDCVDCHMPKAAKSARKDSDYVGDITSHLFQIRNDNGDKTTMWTSDGKFVQLDEFGRGWLTLDFACYSCHETDQQPGGALDLDALAAMADGMHSGGTAKVSMK